MQAVISVRSDRNRERAVEIQEHALPASSRVSLSKSVFQRCSSVEDAVQLTDVFQTELTCLMGTTGRHVVLVINPVTGVTLARVLSGLETPLGGTALAS